MRYSELKMMIEEYVERYGFLPGALVFGRDAVGEVDALAEELMLARDYEALRKQVELGGVSAYETKHMMGLGLRYDETATGVRLDRRTGSATSIRMKDAKDFYNPQADITNSMASVARAALSFFDKRGAEDDEAFVEFAKKLAEFLALAKTPGKNWTHDGEPALSDMLKTLSSSDFQKELALRFMTVVLDFYWHSCALAAKNPDERAAGLLDKALKASALLRTLPTDLREPVEDSMMRNGLVPEIMIETT